MNAGNEKARLLRETFEKNGDTYELAKRWRDEGVKQLDLYLIFADLHTQFAEEGTARLEDLESTMDAIWGWGPTQWHLFTTGLSNLDARLWRKPPVDPPVA